MTTLEKLIIRPSPLSLRDEIKFMFSWDRAQIKERRRGFITTNFLSADYKVSRANNKSKKVTINVII